MAKSRFQLSDLSPLEILGGFFGYFAVANDIPNILRKLSVRSLVPDSWKACLLRFNSNPDFWYLITFTLLVIVGLLRLISSQKPKKEDPNQDTPQTFETLNDDTFDLEASWKRMRKISILRSFGLILVREWILNRLKISLYGTFKRQSDWEPQPERFDYIDRINYDQGEGYEFQYSKNFKFVIVRTHPSDNSTYGPSSTRTPNLKEIRDLLFASNFFPFWCLIHLLRRSFI